MITGGNSGCFGMNWLEPDLRYLVIVKTLFRLYIKVIVYIQYVHKVIAMNIEH